MPLFHYKARDRQTRKVQNGSVEAADKVQAIKKLKTKGLLVLSVGNSHSFHVELAFLNRASAKDRILFAREFAVMMRAGLPILDSLRALEEQTSSQVMKKTIGQLSKEIEGGTSLSEAFGHYPNIFPPIFVSVTKIGEKSGRLEEVLERLATQLEKDDELISRIRGAMIYPIFVLSALVGVIIVIMVYIIPQLKTLFDDANVALPTITRVILAMSAFMQKYLAGMIVTVIVLVVGTKYLNHRSEKSRYRFERARMVIPVFGKLYKQMVMARFTHTLATLLNAGLPMQESIKTTASVLNSPTFTRSMIQVGKEIESGQTLSKSLLADKNYPTMIGHMVAIGEKSGEIDEILETVAGFFDKEVDGLTRNLSALLEPILMLLMGAGVGLVVAAVIVPIYNLVNAV
jgi:type IV pilus assembly protein PilC